MACKARKYFTGPVANGAPNPSFHIARLPSLWNAPLGYYIPDCENLYLVENYESANGYNYDGYYIDLWERPCGSNTNFSWRSTLGSTYAQLPQTLDIKTAFNQKGVIFTAGTEYRVKLAMWNDCDGWEEFTLEFCVTECAQTRPVNTTSTINNNNKLIEADLRIFPNPTRSMLNVEVANLEITELHIIDALGRRVANYKNTTAIDVQTLETGWYLLEAVTKQGIIRKKFIKK